MKVLLVLALFVFAVPCFAQERNPLALPPEHQDIAEVGRWVTASIPVALDAIDIFKSGNKDRAWWNFACRVGGSLGAALGAQYLIDAQRPNGEPHGFPSAHQAFVQSATGGKGLRLGLSVSFNVLTALGSMASNRHTASQVTGGEGFGIAVQSFCDRVIKVEE